MIKYFIFSNLIILSFLFATNVSCFKPPDYCGKKYIETCNALFTGHIGCPPKHEMIERVPEKLSKNERVLLIKYFNEVRDHIALTKNIANMIELSWNEEYEYLAEKAIEKLTITNSGCSWTESSKVFPTELNIIKTAINFDGTWSINLRIGGADPTSGNPYQMSDTEFKKYDKIKYLVQEVTAAMKSEGFSVLHDPISNLVGCSWTQTSNVTHDFKQIRCIINARTFDNSTYYIFDKPCSKCASKSKCSKDFKHLCSSSGKIANHFWLASFFIVLLGLSNLYNKAL